MERATELEYLQYFYAVADFGPADEDIRYMIKQKFKEETGKELPIGYTDDWEDGED